MYPLPSLPDEPRIYTWLAQFREGEESRALGGSPTDDTLALTIALAEAQERHLWVFADDYFDDPTIATVPEMTPRRIVDPRRFAGFSDAQRSENPSLTITDSSPFRWIRAYSHSDGKQVFVPAATVSRSSGARAPGEPLIRRIISTGLATYPDRIEALLRGALEVIERDAYMIAWLNQLSLPRVDLSVFAASDTLAALLAQCTRYRLVPHAVKLMTDAPAHAVCVVLEDESGLPPRYAFGLKAHRSLSAAIEGALIEALRVRRGTRVRLGNPDRPPRPQTIGHYDRHEYWSEGENHEKLAFFTKGRLATETAAPWEHDSPEEHWRRILSWCRERGYECFSVPLTRSRMNVTPWHIEMVVIPELQPIHYSENLPHIGGARLAEIPTRFGYTPCAPFTAEPHPFA